MSNHYIIKNKSINDAGILKRFIAIILMLFSFYNSFSQIPDEFKKVDVFDLDSLSIQNYAYSINSAQDWQVYVENDSLKVKKYKEGNTSGLSLPPIYNSKSDYGIKGDVVSKKVFNGWIVGVDAGEWGGNLKWYSENGKKNYQLYGMVHQLEKYNNSVLALSGIYHMSLSEGILLEINFDKGKDKWGVNPFYKFEKYPFCFTVVKQNIYILTATDLIKLDQNKNVQVLLKNSFWNLAYPNSMIFYKGSIYIGMRGGILKITDEGEKISKEWYENKIKIY